MTGADRINTLEGGSRVIASDRLILRRLTVKDAPFIFVLLNDPGWLRFIGDRGVRNLDDARKYILTGPVEMYARHGFGLFLTELKADATAIGLCGLLKRDVLEDVDVGYAFLPQYRGNGYAFEAAAAALRFGKETVGLKRVAAITNPENARSIRVLEKLGLAFERTIRLSEGAPETSFFARAL